MRIRTEHSLRVSFLVGLCALTASAAEILVDAEGFSDRGGWVVDQQSMAALGSSYLMAHGMGVPVKDAATTVMLPTSGTWFLWVRTRDWSPFPVGPGAFKARVDGALLEQVLGINGDGQWKWYRAGQVTTATGQVQLALVDQTGLHGRCDAVLFSDNGSYTPPNDIEGIAALRRASLQLPAVPPNAGDFDVVVVGGGIAGCCAAMSAANSGLRVALIQDRPELGGNNSSEIGVGVAGGTHLPPYDSLGWIVEFMKDKKNRQATLESYESLRLFLNMHVFGADTADGAIEAVRARHIVTNSELRFPARLFVDCTGDGNLGLAAGAEFRYGRESKAFASESRAPDVADSLVMGSTNFWSTRTTSTPFPEVPWAHVVDSSTVRGSGWAWESGFFQNPATDAEYIRDNMFRATYGTVYHKSKTTPNIRVSSLNYISGKRESRRLVGDYTLIEQDITANRSFPDQCVGLSWGLDLHYPVAHMVEHYGRDAWGATTQALDPSRFPAKRQADATRGVVPYRCLYSRNIANLFMAGRCISVSHVALGATRVQATHGLMGEVVGLAAYLCVKHDTSPHRVYEEHLDEFKGLLLAGRAEALPVGALRGESGGALEYRLSAEVAVAGHRFLTTFLTRLPDGVRVQAQMRDTRGRVLAGAWAPVVAGRLCTQLRVQQPLASGVYVLSLRAGGTHPYEQPFVVR